MRIMTVAFALATTLVLCSPEALTAAARAKAKVVHEPRTKLIVRPIVTPVPYWDSYIVPRYRYRPEDDRVDPYGPPVVPVIRYGNQEIFLPAWNWQDAEIQARPAMLALSLMTALGSKCEKTQREQMLFAVEPITDIVDNYGSASWRCSKCVYGQLVAANRATWALLQLLLSKIAVRNQFERELASERVRDKVAASRKKGKWTGGTVPLGYDARDKKLVVNKSEAETVRTIFSRYLELKSFSRMVADLDQRGINSGPPKSRALSRK